MIIGVDTGGTFTDFVFIWPDGRLAIAKVPSTPTDPSEAIVRGLPQELRGSEFSIVHGTTVATNALLERKGAKTALITSQGCRDVLEIARQTREELYSLCPKPRNPLIPRSLRFEVPERLDWQGWPITPLDGNAVERVLDQIRSSGVESIAVCFLFSFLNPQHELEVKRRAMKRGFRISISSEIAPEYREYERASTVCANACVAPVMVKYIERLEQRIRLCSSSSPEVRLSIMQSSGGTLRADEASAQAIKTVLSGPAGGLIAAVHVAREAGFRKIITFDMGGTSTDVALVDGEPVTVRNGEVAGIPLLTPMLDIHTVGAGGGSIARIDAGGGLRVGPQSAGADPGPVAYGRGDLLTVTDANVLLGRLPASTRLAGSLGLDVKRVDMAFNEFAAHLNLNSRLAAEGIVEVVNSQLARALRHISVERGHDPSTYTLVSFGGAGGLHACALAESLGVKRILVPRFPGAFSALGLALADVRREYVQSIFLDADPSHHGTITKIIGDISERALREIASERIPRGRIMVQPFVEMRYKGQSYALRVPYRSGLKASGQQFHRAHKARYGHADPSQPVECVSAGLTASGKRHVPRIQFDLPPTPGNATEAISVVWDNKSIKSPLYHRGSLSSGQQLAGPAVIVQTDAATWIPPGWRGEVDRHANLIMEI